MMIIDNINYFAVILILSAGLYLVCLSKDYIRKLFGVAIFQVAVLLFYISLGFVNNSRVPILEESMNLYSNPIPHVLMLTAIVVGVATLSVGLSIAIKINKIMKETSKKDVS